jgi:hypothetical protein
LAVLIVAMAAVNDLAEREGASTRLFAATVSFLAAVEPIALAKTGMLTEIVVPEECGRWTQKTSCRVREPTVGE